MLPVQNQLEVVPLNRKIQIGALISGGGTNLQAIIDACNGGRINGQMVFVGSDSPDAGGLERANRDNLATFVVDYQSIIREFNKDPQERKVPEDFDLDELVAKQSFFATQVDPQKIRNFLMTRAIAEAKLLEAVESHSFDLLVLAGFMRNLTPYFIDRVNTDYQNPRIMNIHPALLPAFPGVDGYGDTYRYGCKVGGCTVHFIDYGEDTGPIIGQRAFQVEPQDSLDSVHQKGLALEWELYPHCIQLFAQGRISVVRRDFEIGKGRTVTRRIVEIAD